MPPQITGVIFSLLAAGRGIGSIACEPLSEALLKDRTWKREAALGYDTGYGGIDRLHERDCIAGRVNVRGTKQLGMFQVASYAQLTSWWRIDKQKMPALRPKPKYIVIQRRRSQVLSCLTRTTRHRAAARDASPEVVPGTTHTRTMNPNVWLRD